MTLLTLVRVMELYILSGKAVSQISPIEVPAWGIRQVEPMAEEDDDDEADEVDEEADAPAPAAAAGGAAPAGEGVVAVLAMVTDEVSDSRHQERKLL